MKENRKLLFFGIICISAGLFLPVSESCIWNRDIDTIQSVKEYGYVSFSYFLSLFLLLLVAVSGFFIKNIPLTIVMTIIGGIISIVYLLLGQAGWGKPCGSSVTSYQFVVSLGHLVVASTAIQSAIDHKKNQKKKDV